jgi:hypothetical protein
MYLDAFWKQTFAAALTAACQSRAPALGSHPGTKTMLTLASSLGWLIRAFHKAGK